MKRQAIKHPKTLELADRLGMGTWAAVGVLQSLWSWASEYAPDGRVTCSPRVLARALDWEFDEARLIEALVGAGWLDPLSPGTASEGRPEGAGAGGWLIHGWSEHCEDSVHMALARAGRRFADGTVPRMGRLSAREREECAARFRVDGAAAHGVRAEGEACAHVVRTEGAPTDTDTDTEEVVNLADPTDQGCKGDRRSVGRSGSADLHSGGERKRESGEPVSAGEVAERLVRRGREPAREGKRLRLNPDWVRDQAGRIVAITGERPELYLDWWGKVVTQCGRDTGLRDVLVEAVNYAAACGDPGQRKAKDLGELKRPGAYIAGKLRDAGLKLPPPPAVRARGVA